MSRREFRVQTSAGRADEAANPVVMADKFEIEGGCLVFYRTPEGTTLGSMDEKRFRAFKEWDEVEEV